VDKKKIISDFIYLLVELWTTRDIFPENWKVTTKLNIIKYTN
jgi:hypothetical protein